MVSSQYWFDDENCPYKSNTCDHATYSSGEFDRSSTNPSLDSVITGHRPGAVLMGWWMGSQVSGHHIIIIIFLTSS